MSFYYSSFIPTFASENFIMKTTVKIQNLKCAGCMGTISKNLHAIEDIEDLFIDLKDSTVSYAYTLAETEALVEKTLSKLGYPIEGDDNTLGAKAKSYVSCAIGKMTT